MNSSMPEGIFKFCLIHCLGGYRLGAHTESPDIWYQFGDCSVAQAGRRSVSGGMAQSSHHLYVSGICARRF